MAHSLIGRTRSWARVILPFYLLGLGWVVFAPAEQAGHVTGAVAWAANVIGRVGVSADGAYVVLEFLANIALFVPFGVLILLGFARLSPWVIVALGFATSVTIELIQLALPTRYSTISDVIANTLGAGVGVLLVALLHRMRNRAGTR